MSPNVCPTEKYFTIHSFQKQLEILLNICFNTRNRYLEALIRKIHYVDIHTDLGERSDTEPVRNPNTNIASSLLLKVSKLKQLRSLNSSRGYIGRPWQKLDSSALNLRHVIAQSIKSFYCLNCCGVKVTLPSNMSNLSNG